MVSVIPGPPKRILTVPDYINNVLNYPNNNATSNIELQFLYRGHSDVKYKLKPSISRHQKATSVETRLIEKARNRMPNTFSYNEDILATLAKMQHYGLPTRLLDFTQNPLVALYFACKNWDADGEVLVINNHVHDSGKRLQFGSSLMYEEPWNPEDRKSEQSMLRFLARFFYDYHFVKKLILSCIDKVPDEGISVQDYIGCVKNEQWFIQWSAKSYFNCYTKSRKAQCIAALLKEPIVVETKDLIQRQIYQQGVYLLLPNKVEKGTDGKYYIYKELPELYHHKEKEEMMRYIIKAENKEKIMKELDNIGINEGSLFGDSVDHICRYIKDKTCGEEI